MSRIEMTFIQNYLLILTIFCRKLISNKNIENQCSTKSHSRQLEFFFLKNTRRKDCGFERYKSYTLKRVVL